MDSKEMADSSQRFTRRQVLSMAVGTLSLSVSGCLQSVDPDTEHVVEESFITPARGDNLDQPAVWHGDEEHLLLVTAKSSHELVVFDASNGEYLRQIGGEGDGIGEFQRPNGLFVIDDLAVVVERDNHRVQILRLPDGEPIGIFGEDQLQKPYEGYVYEDAGEYNIYVTDNYDASETSELGERVKHYRFTASTDGIDVQHVRSFGATAEDHALYEVESIFGDPLHDRLLLADETDHSIKSYTLNGNFIDIVTDRFDGRDPEGITLYGNDPSGYWLFTNQAGGIAGGITDYKNRFYVYNRNPLEYRTSFSGETTTNTDGVWFTREEFGAFSSGAFYAIDDDQRVSAFDWTDIEQRIRSS